MRLSFKNIWETKNGSAEFNERFNPCVQRNFRQVLWDFDGFYPLNPTPPPTFGNMTDIQNEHDVKRLMDTFYAKLLQSEIAYVFTEVAQIDLASHLPVLYNFWNALLFGEGDYRGNPMSVHLNLHQKTPLDEHAFSVWLGLFDETVDELFEGKKAIEAKQKARNIAGMMQHTLARTTGT